MIMTNAGQTFMDVVFIDDIRQYWHLVMFAGNVRDQAAAMESINEDNKASVILPASENCSITETDLKGGRTFSKIYGWNASLTS